MRRLADLFLIPNGRNMTTPRENMKPIPQTVLYGDNTTGNGNCFDACLASLLEIPLWMVPPFHQMFGRPDRSARMSDWLEIIFGVDLEWASPGCVKLPEFYIVSGESPRNPKIGHAVIHKDGVLAHDPHHEGGGIVGPPRVVYYLVPTAKGVHSCVPKSSYLQKTFSSMPA